MTDHQSVTEHAVAAGSRQRREDMTAPSRPISVWTEKDEKVSSEYAVHNR